MKTEDKLAPPRRRMDITVRGAVQGVGFRPFVYSLARRLSLGGSVRNTPAGVGISIEGLPAAVDAFVRELSESPPRLARIHDVSISEAPPAGVMDFAIDTSAQRGERTVAVMPDIATCPDCLRELQNPQDRRFRYPFINCTNCGPRYTIIRDLPYDRQMTTMAAFAMCPACRTEYENPADRRFHAEPVCCPACGPRLWLADNSGHERSCGDPIREAIQQLERGMIVAVKGLGGFHLACDASNAEAVQRLRQRKHRDLKPFAVMVRDLTVAHALCAITQDAEEVLTAPERPIVLAEKRDGQELADQVAPRSACFGLMLPYTPLHHLLMEGSFKALVMTSGNLSDEPIAHTNDDAFAKLGPIADSFLVHNREVHVRTDDSVTRLVAGGQRFVRRSRGYAPFPVELPLDTHGHEILAVGPELSNTICLTRHRDAFLSHHLGDLQNLPAYEAFRQAVEHMSRLLDIVPSSVACDLHPGYLSTRYARETGLPVIQVQHHHAHIASVLAEHGRADSVIGVAFDGIGWGDDGLPWGGEFLVCDLGSYQRAGHLECVPQPGGDSAAKEIDRMAYAFLLKSLGEEAEEAADTLLPGLPAAVRQPIATMIERQLNCPLTSSMGRLFDAVSALLGICNRNVFHAQAPMELEAFAARVPDEMGHYPAGISFGPSGSATVHTTGIVKGLIADIRSGVEPARCAARFHNSVVAFTVDMCRAISENTGLRSFALSGGVFVNKVLTERLTPALESAGFEVLMNVAVPPGDGGVSLGQAAVAARRTTCA